MPYRYNYGALMSADATTNNNFEPLNNVVSTASYNNQATALLEAQGLVAGTPEANEFIANANAAAGNSQVAALQNIAGLSESDTAVARGDTWGGSDTTMGKSWLEKVAAGEIDVSGGSVLEQVNQLYTQGFGRVADTEGLTYWSGQSQHGGQTIQDIAKSFVASEEAAYRTGYHENYGRDADESGLVYWMSEGQAGGDTDIQTLQDLSTSDIDWSKDTSGEFNKVLQHTGDKYEQKETTIRNRLSAELGIHSSDAQRLADTSLHGADGIAGTDDDVFTDASEADVFRMMTADDLGEQEVTDKVKMQKAAQYMGDYGGGVNDVGATNIHRKLANQEMGLVDYATDADGNFIMNPDGSPKMRWETDVERIRKTGSDYLPETTTTYDSEGNPIQTTTHNQWGLLKENTQLYGKPEVKKVLPEIEGAGTNVGPILVPGIGGTDTIIGGPSLVDPGDTGGESGEILSTDKIKVSDETRDYLPNLDSDIKDTSPYGTSKELFDATAKGITPPGEDELISRSVPTERVGGSAKGVRLKRSKKFTSGTSALGTKQFGRKQQRRVNIVSKGSGKQNNLTVKSAKSLDGQLKSLNI